MQRAEGYAHQAAEQVREASSRVRERVENGYGRAEGMVQSRPAESVLMAFGCGLAVGVGVTLLLSRDRPSDSLWSRSRDSAECLARRLADALSSRSGSPLPSHRATADPEVCDRSSRHCDLDEVQPCRSWLI